jgi:hypothetical protein
MGSVASVAALRSVAVVGLGSVAVVGFQPAGCQPRSDFTIMKQGHGKFMNTFFVVALLYAVEPLTAFTPNRGFRRPQDQWVRRAVKTEVPEEVDVVVISLGLVGLSCAALLSHCDRKVVVLESHDAPGGAAHSWTRGGFHFESGPSLYSGFSMGRSPNPLKNIFQIIGEDCEWITYDRWGTVLPNGKKFAAKIGPDEFDDVLLEHGGPDAPIEFAALMERMKPLSDAAQALTSLALREDAGVALTLLKYPRELLATLAQGSALNEPFSNIMDEMNIKNEFVKNWLDMLCFLLQGLPAAGTMNAVMVRRIFDGRWQEACRSCCESLCIVFPSSFRPTCWPIGIARG